MNPTLPADYLARMEADDPEAYRSEVLGEFRTGVSTFLDAEAIEACVADGVREQPRDRAAVYVGHVDSASGSGKDDFAAAVACTRGERAVCAALRRWRPPFNPSGVIAEAAAFFASYGVSEIMRDAYAPGFVDEAFRAHNIRVQPAPRDTSSTYLELLPLVNARRVVFPDHPELLRQLRGLERRRGASGRDRVSHLPGSHDDLAAAAAAVVVALAGRHVADPAFISACLDAGSEPGARPAKAPDFW